MIFDEFVSIFEGSKYSNNNYYEECFIKISGKCSKVQNLYTIQEQLFLLFNDIDHKTNKICSAIYNSIVSNRIDDQPESFIQSICELKEESINDDNKTFLLKIIIFPNGCISNYYKLFIKWVKENNYLLSL